MTELIAKVQQLADLEQLQLELLPEQERLEKEVFDLKIAAHNAQVDAESLEGFSVSNTLLKIAGKYESQLEEAQRQARVQWLQALLAAV